MRCRLSLGTQFRRATLSMYLSETTVVAERQLVRPSAEEGTHGKYFWISLALPPDFPTVQLDS